jgi:hypothetical protein
MSPAEPTLSDVHADLVGRLKHDERIRTLEQGQARVEAVIAELPRMETRIMQAIADNKPKSPWPAVGSLAGVMGVLIVVFAAIYGG